jgi:hypothetical protein
MGRHLTQDPINQSLNKRRASLFTDLAARQSRSGIVQEFFLGFFTSLKVGMVSMARTIQAASSTAYSLG